MVKAFAYGSGSFEIANLLQFHQVDYLGVAYADEGVVLRKAGIGMPIMVMNAEDSSFDALVQYNLEPVLYSFPLLRGFDRCMRVKKEKGCRNSRYISSWRRGDEPRLGFPLKVDDRRAGEKPCSIPLSRCRASSAIWRPARNRGRMPSRSGRRPFSLLLQQNCGIPSIILFCNISPIPPPSPVIPSSSWIWFDWGSASMVSIALRRPLPIRMLPACTLTPIRNLSWILRGKCPR